MTNKRLKNISVINIIVAISLLLNVILISKVSDYKKFTYENITRSISRIKSDLESAQEILNQIVYSGEIDEWEYRKIYFDFDSFEHEYKHYLYRNYYELESNRKDFSDINLLFDINDYIFSFGKEKQLSLFKNEKDDVITIDLTGVELEQFKDISKKNKEYINVLNKYKEDRDNGYRYNWVKIVDELYEKGIKTAPEQKDKDLLYHLENKEFITQGETLYNEDEKTIIKFGKAFVDLFNGAVAEQERVSFEKYIENKNLLKFANKTLELTQEQELQGGHGVIYGLENEFKEANLQQIDDNLYYLELPYEFEGSGMSCKMLITTVNTSFKLVDFYFGGKDGVDTYATGHPAEREIKDPKLWENDEWVNGVFNRLAEFEERFNDEIITR